ncbi:hypothetical protein PHET_11438 [Paragonimus heterotremus]|uniref:Uncharacterized protein n=1 Tax=Paragonimus heterotremus TaxID=100268 RepID=A0A8J4WCM1_9TREM|nr:hypothetical protein PHET_11438 [Paragonimus heterotremus]
MEFPTSFRIYPRMNRLISETTISRHGVNIKLLQIFSMNRVFISDYGTFC